MYIPIFVCVYIKVNQPVYNTSKGDANYMAYNLECVQIKRVCVLSLLNFPTPASPPKAEAEAAVEAMCFNVKHISCIGMNSPKINVCIARRIEKTIKIFHLPKLW